MLIDREGRFRAYPLEIAVGENDNKLTTVTIEFSLSEEYETGTWRDCSNEKMVVTAWFYLEKRNGDVNELQVDQLKRAFGWDGRDVFWLEDTDLSNVGVQVDVKEEEWQGVKRFKVKWLHSGDSDPDRKAKKSNENTRRSVNSRLAMKLRALAGKTPAPAPAAPAAPSPQDEAWEAFKKKCPSDFTEKRMEAEWFHAIALMFPDADIKSLSVGDWKRFVDECDQHITPF